MDDPNFTINSQTASLYKQKENYSDKTLPIPNLYPKNVNIVPNNVSYPYGMPKRVSPTNYFGIDTIQNNDKKRILLGGIPTGSTKPGVPNNCLFPHQYTMTGQGN